VWDNVLSLLPNELDNISESLEREYILRRFNKDYLHMEMSNGSQISRIIGMGEKVDRETGKTEKLGDIYPSYFRNVVRTFEIYPIYKHFGITIDDAMAMEFDRWVMIRKAAEKLPEEKNHDVEGQLLQIIKELSGFRGGEG